MGLVILLLTIAAMVRRSADRTPRFRIDPSRVLRLIRGMG
jgi:hypothetical protein